MAGGEGSRLRPLTCDKPKPMVPVMNRPLMEYSVELLRACGLRDIAVTLQYLPEQIREHFGDGSRFGVNLQYYVEEDPLGTAGSVKNAAPFLDETFVVVSGDALTDVDLTEAIAFHRSRGALATLVLKSVENPLEYGVVMLDPGGRIVRFLEKPGWGEVFSDTVNTGIYILEPEVLAYVEPGKMVDFSKDIFPRLLERGEPLYGYVMEGFWCDVGDLREYARAHRQVLERRVKVNLKGQEVSPGLWLEEGVYIHPRAQLQPPLYIGSGCSIGANAQIKEGSVLGSHTRVEERATVKRGLTWEGVYIGKGAALRGAILCNQVQLASRASVFEEAVIGDGSVVQEGAVIKPGVKVWPAKVVESGVVLQDSLIWGEKVSRTFFGRDGIRGEINRNLTPEMAVQLGACFGHLLQGGTVLVSGDGHSAAVMLREALVSGLLSAGAAVVEAGEMLIPVARRAIAYLQARGGIHISFPGEDPEEVRLSFFDGEGLPLSRGQERKLEQLFFREDFPRASGREIQGVARMPGLTEIYRRELLQSVHREKMVRAGFRIVLGNPSSHLHRFLVPLLQQLCCAVITINTGRPEGAPFLETAPLLHLPRELGDAVRRNNASLGVIMEPGGEKARLFDERGREVHGDLYTALLSLLVLRRRRGSTVAVPVHVSSVVEQLAERYQGTVLRTKADPRHLMELENENGRREEITAGLHFDAVAALVYLLDFMAVHDLTLSRLLEEIPAIKIREREIPCPWTQKGKVMRRLIQETSPERREMIDGLKVYHPQGWALIMPDPEKPSYRVYGEGFSEEISESLTDFYVRRINSLQLDS